ncbi:hypothetical protein TNCV_1855981 [Trichonephila clavipes]|nr:hypothetical protein TNCV_1855981 [Trichonephila clavipes]
MYASSSYVNPTPLAHADNQRGVHPRGGISQLFLKFLPQLRKMVDYPEVPILEIQNPTISAQLLQLRKSYPSNDCKLC